MCISQKLEGAEATWNLKSERPGLVLKPGGCLTFSRLPLLVFFAFPWV